MESKMKKVLTFFDIFLIGLGYIIGAGMYSLIYLTTKYGREFTWLSFIVGGLIKPRNRTVNKYFANQLIPLQLWRIFSNDIRF